MVIRSIPIAILRAKASSDASQKPFSWRRERDLNPQMVSHVGFRDRDATDYVLSLRLVAGVGFEPHDLQRMRLTSYQTALSRDLGIVYHRSYAKVNRVF